jgi:hypothetical protein
MIHDKIYLQIKDEYGEDQEEISWCEDRQYETDLEYHLVTKIEYVHQMPPNA